MDFYDLDYDNDLFKKLKMHSKPLNKLQRARNSFSVLAMIFCLFFIAVLLILLIFSKGNDISLLEKDKVNLKKNISSIEETIKSHKNSIDSLRHEVTTLKDHIKVNNNIYQDKNGLYSQLQSESNDSLETLRISSQRFENLKEKISKSKNYSKELNKKIKKLKTLIEEQKNLLDQYKEQFKKSKEKVSSSFSRILSQNDLSKLSKLLKGTTNKEISQKTMKLCYSLDGQEMDYDKFREKCGNSKMRPSIVLIKTTEGMVIGGFTTNSWDVTEYQRDLSACTFNLSFNKKYKISNAETAIYTSPRHFIIFGEDAIVISEAQSSTSLPLRDDEDPKSLSFSKNLKIKELEVFYLKNS